MRLTKTFSYSYAHNRMPGSDDDQHRVVSSSTSCVSIPPPSSHHHSLVVVACNRQGSRGGGGKETSGNWVGLGTINCWMHQRWSSAVGNFNSIYAATGRPMVCVQQPCSLMEDTWVRLLSVFFPFLCVCLLLSPSCQASTVQYYWPSEIEEEIWNGWKWP